MKKTLKTILISIFILMPILGTSQNNMEDVVYLFNGSIIRGIIIEQVPNSTIKIQTKDGSIFVFKYEEIERITKENPTTSTKIETPNEYKKNGFYNITEINYSPGIGSFIVMNKGFATKGRDYSFGFRTTNGYQYNEHINFGIGIGIDKYRLVTFIPITFDIRFSLLKGPHSPLIILNSGYSIGLQGIKSGFIMNPALGYKSFIRKDLSFILSAGFKWQSTNYSYIDSKYMTKI